MPEMYWKNNELEMNELDDFIVASGKLTEWFIRLCSLTFQSTV